MGDRDLSGQRIHILRLVDLMGSEQLPQSLCDESEQTLDAGEQDFAEIRRIRTAAATLEQRDAITAFQRSNGQRYGVLGKTYQQRCAANALMVRHGFEHVQLPKAGEMLDGLHGSLVNACVNIAETYG